MSDRDLWAKKTELSHLMERVRKLRSEIQEAEFESRRSKLKRLPPHQRQLLRAFAEGLAHDNVNFDMLCYGRRTLRLESGLANDQLSRALGALRRLGFVKFCRGLFIEDGEVCGSGYGVTKDGLHWWHSVEERINVR